MKYIYELRQKTNTEWHGWALCINSTILQMLDVNPQINMIKYTIENNKLIITKSDKNIEK